MNTIQINKPVANKMLEHIKQKMSSNPKLGNFHLWYFDVYKQMNKRPDVYALAIQTKYDKLGLQSIEALKLLEDRNAAEQ